MRKIRSIGARGGQLCTRVIRPFAGCAFLLSARLAFAQLAPPAAADFKPPPSPVRGDARVVGFIATPFGQNTADAAVGFGVGAGIRWKRIPLTLGVDVMTAYWGSTTSGALVKAGDAIIPANLNRTDVGYFLDASLRVQPVDWLVRPYAEGIVGTKLLLKLVIRCHSGARARAPARPRTMIGRGASGGVRALTSAVSPHLRSASRSACGAYPAQTLH